MSYEVMSSAIENFYAATEGAASRVIAFHGGEPLLHYGEILRVVDKFKCNRTHFLIQTNGTLLSKRCYLLEKNIFAIFVQAV